jgi:serine/threonine protein kinase/tetratricopeptide (TPR) repeat protein
MIGRTVSHYRILEELGSGGMGVVYKAEDTKLKRTVALKFLPSQLNRDTSAKARFVHEARAASALQHHNICTIHEIGETEDGQLFIAMDYYDGETLKARIAKGPLPVSEALDIAMQMAEGLSNAHRTGMVHRDVKPANVMITNDGEVKLVDFGLAKLADTTKVTKTGSTVGTIAYMSPEQARGEDVDQRSDVFSLGSVLYELLTGRPPFEGNHELAVLYQIMHADPKPLVSYRNDLPEDLQRIVGRALEKDVEKRYQAASEFRDDLSAVAGGAPVEHRRLRRSVLRRPPLWWYVATVVSLVAAGLVFDVLRHGPKDAGLDQSSLAVMGFRDLVSAEDSRNSAAVTELVNIGLVESSPIRVMSPEYLYDLRRRLFEESQGPIGEDQTLEVVRRSGATHFLAGTLGTDGENSFVTWRLVSARNGENLGGRRLEGRSLVALADKIIEDVLPLIARDCGAATTTAPTPVDRLTTHSSEAYTHYLRGSSLHEQAKDFEAVAELESAVQLDSTFALAYVGLTRVYAGAHIQDPSRARGYAERAWNLRTRLGIKDRMRLEAYRYDLGGDLGKAVATYQEMLVRWPDDRETLQILVERLALHWGSGQVVEIAERGLALYPDDVIIGGTAYLHSLESVGRTHDALRATREYAKHHPDNPNAWDELGRRYLALGFPDSAETAFGEAVELDPQWYPEVFSSCAYHAGDVERAIEILEKILAREDLLPVDRVRLMITSMFDLYLAALYREDGRFQDALEVCEKTRQYVSSPRAQQSNEMRIGSAMLSLGRPQDVLVKMQELRRLGSRQWLVFGLQGSAMAALGDLEGARFLADTLYDMQEEAGAKARSLALKIEAEIALAENRPEKAIEALDEMKRQGVLFGGLYDIDHRTATARALSMAGRPEEAAEVHRVTLRVYGGHALSHYELGRIYQDMGLLADAKGEFSTFLEKWSRADEGLPQLEDARSRLAALEAGS